MTALIQSAHSAVFALFFGIMYADLGYGIVLTVLGIVAQKLFKPKGMLRQMMGLMVICGVTTAVMGFAFGGFFGDVLKVVYTEFLGVRKRNSLHGSLGLTMAPFQPYERANENDGFALGPGAVQIITSQCIHIYMGFRDGTGWDAVLDVVPWWVFFAGIAHMVLKGGYAGLIIGVLALVLTQGRHEKNLFLKLFGGIRAAWCYQLPIRYFELFAPDGFGVGHIGDCQRGQPAGCHDRADWIYCHFPDWPCV